MAVRRALRSIGWTELTVTEISDATQAVAALLLGGFDCAFMDYHLPQGTAQEMVEQVRAAGVRTPIIVLTGQGDEQIAVNVLKAGASDYIAKSNLTSDHLQKSLRHVLRVRKAEEESEAARDDLSYVAAASSALAASLDLEETVAATLTIVLKRLADYVALYLRDESTGELQRVGSLHRHPECRQRRDEWLDEHRVQMGERWMADYLGDAAHASFRCFEGESAPIATLATPLRARDQDLGLLVMVREPATAAHSTREIELAQGIAHRCALALDNARLYRLAQEATQMREAFLSIASHELRGPITTMQGYAELLLRRYARDDERERRLITTLHGQARRLNVLLESLLDISRIERGQLNIQCAEVDMAALLTRMVEDLRLTTPAQAIELTVTPADDYTLEADELRLEQVIRNLVQNGIKYSPAGEAVRITLARTPDEIVLRVEDSGVGIPPAALPNLFQRFYRVPGPASERFKGAGLGLYVVREIVTQHGGHIAVESQEGVGSCFTVSLPLRRL